MKEKMMKRQIWLIGAGLLSGMLLGCADDFVPRNRSHARAVEDPIERGSERSEILGDSDGSGRTGMGVPIAEVDFGKPGTTPQGRITAVDNFRQTFTTQPATTIPTATAPSQPPTVIVIDPITGKRP